MKHVGDLRRERRRDRADDRSDRHWRRADDRLQRLLDTDETSTDVGEWLDATKDALADATDGRATVDEPCTFDGGRHAFVTTDGDEQRDVWVLDPLAYPSVTGTPGTVRSTTPVREETPVVSLSADGVEGDHGEAVLSIGVSDDVDAVDGLTPEILYDGVCGYIHAFADEAEYATWAEGLDGETTSLPLETGVDVAGSVARDLFAATPAVE